jgi:hypothetical protein
VFLFGTGRLLASQIGSAGVLASPIEFGILQDTTVDLKIDLKELWGGNRFPVSVVDGKGSIDITAKSARISAGQIALAFGGTSSQGGGVQIIQDELHVVAANIVTLANTPNTAVALPFVMATIGGVQTFYTVLTSGPAVAGVSCVLAGSVLTFAVADNGVTALSTYYSTVTGAADFSVTVANPLVASAPAFQVALSCKTNNPNNNLPSSLILEFNRVIPAGMKLDIKVDDFLIPDFTMKCFADGNNQIGTAYVVN